MDKLVHDMGDIVDLKLIDARTSPRNVYESLSDVTDFEAVFNGVNVNAFRSAWHDLVNIPRAKVLVIDSHLYEIDNSTHPYYLVLYEETLYWIHGFHLSAVKSQNQD